MSERRPDPKWELAERRAVALRELGYTYEEIARMVSTDAVGFTATWVYRKCHPEKTDIQILTWRQKHDPDPDGWADRPPARGGAPRWSLGFMERLRTARRQGCKT